MNGGEGRDTWLLAVPRIGDGGQLCSKENIDTAPSHGAKEAMQKREREECEARRQGEGL